MSDTESVSDILGIRAEMIKFIEKMTEKYSDELLDFDLSIKWVDRERNGTAYRVCQSNVFSEDEIKIRK
jgi:hypothetical protein